MMTMSEYLEQDRTKVLSRLRDAQSASDIVSVLNAELDRLLLFFNRDADDDKVRNTAAEMIQVAKLAVGFNDNVAGVNLYKKSENGKTEVRKLPFYSVLLIIAAGICTAGCGLIFAFSASSGLRVSDAILFIVLLGISPFLAALSQRLAKSKNKDEQYKTEIEFDTDRIWQNLKYIVFTIDRRFTIDRSLKEKAGPTLRENESLQAGKGLPDSELIDFMAELLDAEYSRDGLYALEKLKNVQFYLHGHGIETEDFDGSNRSRFEIMPAEKEATLRPALIKDGKLIKKGLAAEKR